MSDGARPAIGVSVLDGGWLGRRGSSVQGLLLATALCFAVPSPRAWAEDTPQSDLRADPSLLCDAAAARVSRESGIPLAVLQAISLTETGRRRHGALRPWPWTVNMEGKGDWFGTREQALAHVEANFTRGARSFDVGCFQLNFRWHGDAFRSIEEMFDPLANARYAAAFLAELHAELGNWSAAAGAYHSRTPEYARRYRARFDTILAALEGDAFPGSEPGSPLIEVATAETAVLPERVNSFPLLQTGLGPRSLGSLVPLEVGRSVAFFGLPSSGIEDAL